jgi:SNF2 family DNA or RNA helicase
MDVWAQYWLMDFGELFGNSFWQFKLNYFEEVPVVMRGGKINPSWTEWKITPDGKAQIERLMWSRAIRFSEDECQDMPEKVFIKKMYTPSKRQRKLLVEIDEGHYGDEAKMMMKRQVCSGFFYKTGEKIKDNPKLELLADLLGVMVEHDKVVIFHEFIEECRMIEDLLTKARIGFTSINGQHTDNFQRSKDFQNLPLLRVCIVNPKSGGQSINLHAARYAINFSNGYSVIDWKQKIKRIHRGEIKRKRIYYDLVGRNTIERSIYWGLRNNIDIFDGVMNGKYSYSDVVNGKVGEDDEL